MEEPFTITVEYKGAPHDYEAQLHLRGFSYVIKVQVEGTGIDYERDEEGAFRAILPPDTDQKGSRHPDVQLLKLIAEKIEALLA